MKAVFFLKLSLYFFAGALGSVLAVCGLRGFWGIENDKACVMTGILVWAVLFLIALSFGYMRLSKNKK
jgi:uncharacterized membrane protein YkgB